jgi:DNA-binding beta-propeller fold protein YncE
MIAEIPTGAWIVWFGAFVTIVASASYILDAAQGRIRPSWVTWAVWTATTGLAAAAIVAAGSFTGAIVPAAAFVRCGLTLAAIVIGARRAQGEREPTSRLDWACLAACVAAGIAWWATSNPILALVAAIAVDGIAAIPTYRRAWQRCETWGTYAGAAVNAACVVLVLRERSFIVWAYPLYELTLTTTLAAVVLTRGSPRVRHRLAVTPSRRYVAGVVGSTVGVLGLAVSLAIGLIPLPSTDPGPALAGSTQPLAAAPWQVAPAMVDTAGMEVAASAAIPSIGMHLPVPPTPGYIELTPDGRQAWIAHRNTGVVSVLDVTTGRIVGQLQIPAGPPQFLTFCPDGRRAYVSVYTDGQPDAPHVVAVLDRATITQVAEIPVGRRPFASDCSSDGRTVVVPSHDDGLLDVIDTETNTLREKVTVPHNPHWVTHTPDGRWWTANHESNMVVAYDPQTFARTDIPLELPGPDGVVRGISPHSIAPSPDGSRLAVVCFDSSAVWIIDAASGRPVRSIRTMGQGPQDVAWAADGRRLYTADVYGDVVSVVDPDAGTVTAWPSPGDAPVSVATTRDGRAAYVATLNDARVTILDTAVPMEK